MRDIGDMNAYLKMSVWQLNERNSVIEILGIIRVNGESENLSEVPALFYFCFHVFFSFSFQVFGFLLHIFREVAGKSFFQRYARHLGVIFSRQSQDFDYLALWSFFRISPGSNDAEDFFSRFGAV